MAKQVLQHAPAPVAPELARATPRQGYIDFYGYHTISGGWVFVGWVDSPPLKGENSGTIAIDATEVRFVNLQPVDDNGASDLALALTLPCWTLLGMLDRAMALTRSHVLLREQFGAPLATLQGVQFQLTEAEVERTGLDVLAKYTLWSIQAGNAEALDDALALRLAAVEAAQTVFRVAHQLHGASGFCDETTLSWISRYSLPIRRIPWGPSGTLDALTRRIGRRGLTGLFGDAHEKAMR